MFIFLGILLYEIDELFGLFFCKLLFYFFYFRDEFDSSICWKEALLPPSDASIAWTLFLLIFLCFYFGFYFFFMKRVFWRWWFSESFSPSFLSLLFLFSCCDSGRMLSFWVDCSRYWKSSSFSRTSLVSHVLC